VSVRTDPLTRTESFTYDGEDNVLTSTDRKSQITTHTYDELGRRTLTTWHGGATTATTATTYDAGDRPTQITDSVGGTITRTYDNRFDTPATEVAPLGAGTSTLTRQKHGVRSCNRASLLLALATTAYTYDAGDRPTQITDSVGGTITRAYENGARRFSGGSRSAGT